MKTIRGIITVICCLLAVPVLAAPPSTSRLSLHLIMNYTGGAQSVVNAHPRILKILDTGGAMLQAMRDYKAGTPGGVVVLRIYTPKHYNITDDPTACANDFWNTVLAPPINGLSPSDRALIDYVEGPNEGDTTPTFATIQDAQWFNTFWLRLADLIGGAGFKPCGFSIAVGNPGGDQTYIHQVLDAIVPALRRCAQYGGGWGYHSYTLDYTTDPNIEWWGSLRHRQYYQYFASNYPDLANLPLLLTEGGTENGWKADGSGTATQFQNWLAWYDTQLAQDSYVIGCTMFQSGDPGGWGNFDMEPINGWLAAHLNSMPGSGGAPPAPTGLAATPGDQRVTLTWNASSGATSYKVKRATTSGGPYTVIVSNITPTSYVNTGLNNNTTYYYVVSAVNASGESANSSQASATPSGMNNNTPTGVNAALSATQYSTDSNYSPSFAGDKAKDGIISAASKWTSAGTAPPHWLAFDLGSSKVVTGFIVRHAGAAGEQTYYNTKNFSIQSGTSMSGPWLDEVVVDNTAQANFNARSYITPKSLRYVRLYISNAGIDNYARIPEFEVWGGQTTVAEDFNALPAWNSGFDAPWGGAASWSVVSGGQSANCLQASRSNTGSSAKVRIYNISANSSYTISIYVRCPSSSSSYWAETAFKLGSNTAQDFDQNAGSWTMIKKFDNVSANGNGDVWTQYSLTFSSGANTQISVGYKLGASSGNGPVVKWDTLRIQ